MKVVINHSDSLDLDKIMSVANGAHAHLDGSTRDMLEQRRADIETFVEAEAVPAYGFNRGFGHNVDLSVPSERLEELQDNLIISHAVGVGDPAPIPVVRIAVLLRAQSLALGHSGVRPELVQGLLDLLNAGVTPYVPQLGSVGASGDLAPLSHIAMCLLGKGKAYLNDELMDAADALEKAGLKPLALAMKEGLALNNGVQFMNAIGLYAVDACRTLLDTAAANTALTAQVMLAPDFYYRPDFHALRPHPGAMRMADIIWKMMQDSPIREAHKDYDTDGQIQDPYNIRCAAQILGAACDLIDAAERALLIEAGSATDNPILLPKADGKHTDIVSGGHFHGMPVAVQIFNLLQSLSIIASLAHQRSARFVDPFRNKGLGRDLKWPGLSEEDKAVSSGMMMLEYTSASLTNDIWGACNPSHLYNIPTNSGQEDHVSMGTTLAVRLLGTLPKATRVIAIELAYIRQATAVRQHLDLMPTEGELPQHIIDELAELRDRLNGSAKNLVFDARIIREHPLTQEEKQLSPVCEKIISTVDEVFPVVHQDRFMAPALEKLTTFVANGTILRLIEKP